jgi:arsenate reductase
MQKFNVLFVCPGNSVRSQLAEALLRHRAGDLCEAYSGGTSPRALNPLTVRVLEEMGLSTAGLRVKRAESLAGVAFDYVIALAGGTAWTCVANWPGSPQRLFWMFENPAMCDDTDDEPLERFREVRDQIDARIGRWLEELRSAAKRRASGCGTTAALCALVLMG